MTADDIAQELATLLWGIRLYWLVILLYGAAWLAYVAEFRGARWPAGKVASLVWPVAVGLHTLFLVLRALDSGWLPVVTGYDRLALLTWGLAVGYNWYERKAGNHLLGLTVPLVAVLLGVLGQAFYHPVPVQPAAIYRQFWYVLHACVLLGAYSLASFACAAEWLPALLHVFMRGNPRQQALLVRCRDLAGRLADRFLSLAFPLLLLAIGCEGLWNSAVMGTIWLWEWTGSWSLVMALSYTFYFHARAGTYFRPRHLALFNTLGFLLMIVSLAGMPGQGLPGFPAG